MGVVSDLKGPIAGLVVCGLVFVGIGLFGVLEVLAVLSAPAPTLIDLVRAALPYVVGLVVVGLAGLGFGAWGVYRLARTVDTSSLDPGAVQSLVNSVQRRYL